MLAGNTAIYLEIEEKLTAMPHFNIVTFDWPVFLNTRENISSVDFELGEAGRIYYRQYLKVLRESPLLLTWVTDKAASQLAKTYVNPHLSQICYLY